MNSLMPAQAEPWATEPAVSAYAPVARPLPPPRVLTAVPLTHQPLPTQFLPSRPALRPRPAAPAGRHAWAIRLLDIVVAGAALALLAPVLLAIALAIKLLDPGPLLFAHKRLGHGGLPFHCLKFRSMTVDADIRLARLLESDAQARAEWTQTHKLRNDPRITPLGRFLRRSCLDELPQLVNVLRGEMSLVGPRPITVAEASRYGRHFSVYCSLKPGITGLWQVKRQNQTSYRRRVAFDLAYARSRSLALNVAILLLTVPSVLRGQGAC